MRPAAWLAALAALVGGCDEVSAPPVGAPAAPPAWADVLVPAAFDPDTAVKLGARDLLVRLSLDLRGVRPVEAELDAVAADPSKIPGLIDEMLASERFGERVRDLYAQVLRTRVEDFPVTADMLGFPAEDQLAVYASIGEEPLQVIARIAAEDRPWTEAVTADWSMADEVLGAMWPVDYPAGASGWQVVHYTDGRPMAGILSENAFWWRYLSDGVNYGRGRANAVARVFLCADFLDRPIDFPRDIDLTDEAGIREAVRENRGCIGCHAGLDPLASYLAGFQYTDKTAAELLVYHPEREPQWREMTELAPGFYGAPGYSLRDLGRQLAADPRYVSCAVETVWELLLRRPPNLADPGELDALTRHREAFLAGGLTLRALFRSIALDPRYALAEPFAELKVVTPEQWSDVLEDWTGFRFLTGGADVLATDETGLRTLAGGGDGRAGGDPADIPTATMALAWSRTAEAAAAYAVENPRLPPDARALFTVDLDADPEGNSAVDDAAMRAQVQALHRRFFGTAVALDGLEVRATLSLWDNVHAIDGARGAWGAVLTTLLRDPSLVLY